jgi:type I restriction enzyme S subunit
MNENNIKIPSNWILVTLEEILSTIESGGRPKGGVRNIKDGIPSIGGEHLSNNGGFDFSNLRYIPKDFFENMKKGKIKKYDVLVVKDGATTGKTSFVSDSFPFKEAAVNEHVFILRTNDQVTLSKYLFFWMRSPFGQNSVKDNFQGTAQGGINTLFVKNSIIPIPPLSEQQRIVAKIEELFTKLDAGVEALKKAKEQIKRYRQAVLKYAFEGKLTEEWRKSFELSILNDELKQTQNPQLNTQNSTFKTENSTLNTQHSKFTTQNYEPASMLLELIKAERKKKLGKKYRELPPIDTSELPELPKGWVWVRLGEIAEMIQYGTSEKATNKSIGIPVLRMGNIQDGKIIFNDLKYFPKEWPRINEFFLQDGDILFNRTNSAELVGKTAVYKKFHPPAVFASYLIRIKIKKNFYVSDLLSYFINSIFGRQYIASVVSQQVGQANVNGTKLSFMPLPFPPLPEQQKIVEEIERRFSVADEVEKTIDQCLKQAERLRQSILKKAFEGKLVPQDPNDEPAEKLLERIKNV